MDTLQLLPCTIAIIAMMLFASAVFAQTTPGPSQAILVLSAFQAVVSAPVFLCWCCWQLASHVAVLLYNCIKFVVKGLFRKYLEGRTRKHNSNVACGLGRHTGGQLQQMSNNCVVFSRPGVFRLLALPLEIRQIIYTLSVEHYDQLQCRPVVLIRPRTQFRHAMALARTCRQIHDEVITTVFSSTLLQVWIRYPFYQKLAPHVWLLLRKIHVAAVPIKSGMHSKSKFRSTLLDLRHMLNLREIYVTVDDAEQFRKHLDALSALHSDLRRLLTRLSLVQIIVKSLTVKDSEVRGGLLQLLSDASQSWPTGTTFSLSGLPNDRKYSIWNALVATGSQVRGRKCTLEY